MTDLWAFLMQTLTVSLVAALLLVLKAAFRDKLSPRWQYGVWAILALRVVLPAGMGGQMLFPFFRWVETARLTVESHLSSAFLAISVCAAHCAPPHSGRSRPPG